MFRNTVLFVKSATIAARVDAVAHVVRSRFKVKILQKILELLVLLIHWVEDVKQWQGQTRSSLFARGSN